MKMSVRFLVPLAISAIGMSASVAAAQEAGGLIAQRDREQMPCAVAPVVLDSARADVADILFSDNRLITEMRREQHLPDSPAQVTVSAVSDGSLCRQLASQLDHALLPTTRLAVLRVGSIFYARDPDQSRATGVFADSTLHVVMRLGAAIDQ
jgi:hypothetical protein